MKHAFFVHLQQTPFMRNPWTWMQRVLGVDSVSNPRLFLSRVHQGLTVAMVVLLALAGWGYVGDRTDHFHYSMGGAFLAWGPMAMAATAVGRVPDTLRRFVFYSVLSEGLLLFLSLMMLAFNLELMVPVLWLMLLLMAFQSRLHENREISWTHHETTLAGLCALLALVLYVQREELAWLLVVLIVSASSFHRALVWRTLRTQGLSTEQHKTVWPRIAARQSTAEFWAALCFHVELRGSMGPAALEQTFSHLSMDTLLGYFENDEHFKGTDIAVWQHEDVTRAVQARVCALDEGAHVIFDLHEHDMPRAAQLIRDVQAGKVVRAESLVLPDLDVV